MHCANSTSLASAIKRPLELSNIDPMKYFLITLAFMSSIANGAVASRASNTVVIDETGVKNLKLETVDVEESDFEESIFTLGRIEALPANRAAVSSRISGRILSLDYHLGDTVSAGADVAKIESRQPGEPPPIISLKAPMSGMITKTTIIPGDPIEPDKSLLEITNLEEVYAIACVPENQVGAMKPGTVAHIRAASLPNKKFDGKLIRFATEADRETGTIDAIFRLPNPGLTLRPGMRAEFSIVLSHRANVMSIPRAALQGDAANRFVYIKDSDPKLKNTFLKTNVVVGQVNDRQVEIMSGLFPADEVVTRGAYSLSFAGGGSLSLKEALDVAHGHEHAADGSELKPGNQKNSHQEHHNKDEDSSLSWKICTGILAILLALSLIRRESPNVDISDVEETQTEVSDHA
jgi:cobalt-zinc-cadmium efflux system membrane fusion protein